MVAPLTPSEMGKKGAARRWAKTTKAQREAYGRKLARARWDAQPAKRKANAAQR
jgi:hypothetical protein